MVVRIALQCNEADAFLIMDDSNPAPRLLSRPGEAIYNDTAGSVEGNSPFQVVWLPEAERDAMLERIVLRVDRASHTVEQLLTMAKVDPDSPMATATLDLRALVVEILAETGHLATDRDLEIDLQGPSPFEVCGSEEALAIDRHRIENDHRHDLLRHTRHHA